MDKMAAVRKIWKRSCDDLKPKQQEELCHVLVEFKRSTLEMHGPSRHAPAAFPWCIRRPQRARLIRC